MKIKNLKGNEKGFTLLEVLIAIVLLGIISAGLVECFATLTKTLMTADTQEKAKDLALSEMEYFLSQPYQGSNANGTNPYTMPPSQTNTQNLLSDVKVMGITWNAGEEEEIYINISLNGKTLFTLADFRTPYAD